MLAGVCTEWTCGEAIGAAETGVLSWALYGASALVVRGLRSWRRRAGSRGASIRLDPCANRLGTEGCGPLTGPQRAGGDEMKPGEEAGGRRPGRDWTCRSARLVRAQLRRAGPTAWVKGRGCCEMQAVLDVARHRSIDSHPGKGGRMRARTG